MALVLDGNGDITGLATGALPANVVGTGAVLQVVQSSTTTKTTTTSATYADTTLTASITPTSTSSKVLVIISQGFYNSGTAGGSVRIVRGSTTLIEQGYAPWDGSAYMTMLSLQHLDSPSTTSSTTYKTTFARPYGSGNLHAQYDDAGGDQTSYITLMEIAG